MLPQNHEEKRIVALEEKIKRLEDYVEEIGYFLLVVMSRFEGDKYLEQCQQKVVDAETKYKSIPNKLCC